MTFDTESAKEGQRRGVETKKRRKTMSPEERALEAIGADLGRLANELLDAAHGKGDFEDLKPETRLSAVLRALEWKLGKAPTAKLPPPKPETQEVPTGEELFAD